MFPVAMRTIMVSPTARPKPTITAEKMPGLAVGRTTRVAVCQRLAPSASDAAVRCCGTLEKASSEIVKMIGMTANPMARPTTTLLRWSYTRPSADPSHCFTSLPKTPASTQGPAWKASQPPATRRGRITRTSMPGRSRWRKA